MGNPKPGEQPGAALSPRRRLRRAPLSMAGMIPAQEIVPCFSLLSRKEQGRRVRPPCPLWPVKRRLPSGLGYNQVTGAKVVARTRTKVDAAVAKSSQKNHLQPRQLARSRSVAVLAATFAPVTQPTLKNRSWRGKITGEIVPLFRAGTGPEGPKWGNGGPCASLPATWARVDPATRQARIRRAVDSDKPNQLAGFSEDRFGSRRRRPVWRNPLFLPLPPASRMDPSVPAEGLTIRAHVAERAFRTIRTKIHLF